MWRVEVFSQGKQPPHNEDVAAYDDTSLVLADGATSKNSKAYDGVTGGEVLARIVADVALAGSANGAQLVMDVTDKIHAFYARHEPAALDDAGQRSATTLLVARIAGDELVVTQVGDSPFRINGEQVYGHEKLHDKLASRLRAEYIEATGDVPGGRDFIMPLLQYQYHYQNHPEHPLGYGTVDGGAIPDRYIYEYRFPTAAIRTLELASDGYFLRFPERVSVEEYESMYERIQEEDPDHWHRYPSTKSGDDRTVMIARLQQKRAS